MQVRTADEWIFQYRGKGAYWTHDGNTSRPHALLTSGKHSSGYFNSELVMEDPMLLDEAALDIVKLLRSAGVELDSIDRVVGPAMGAITLSHDIARNIDHTRETERHCLRAYTEKETNGVFISMAFKKTEIFERERVLLVEDVLTTGSSVDLTAAAVLSAGGLVLPFVAVLVNRSGLSEVNGRKIVALIDRPMPVWEQSKCPLCKTGSKAIRPKGTENWAELNAKF